MPETDLIMVEKCYVFGGQVYLCADYRMKDMLTEVVHKEMQVGKGSLQKEEIKVKGSTSLKC